MAIGYETISENTVRASVMAPLLVQGEEPLFRDIDEMYVPSDWEETRRIMQESRAHSPLYAQRNRY